MIANDVVIEVTRRCNMECPHCLRGNKQKISNNYNNIYKFLTNFEYISSLSISGGEPSLPSGVKNIIHIYDILYKYRIDIGIFYIVTNCKRYSKKFIETIIDFEDFVDEKIYIAVSYDKFHFMDVDENIIKYNYFRYLDYLEYNYFGNKIEIIKHSEFLDYNTLINEGRSCNNYNGRNIDADDIIIEYDDDDLNIVEGNLYLNCKGNIIKGCDFSYESQDKDENILSHINNFSKNILIMKGKVRDD